jgi:phage shock protein C
MTSAPMPGIPPTGEQAPPPPAPPARPLLRRSRSDKMLGGVCGGLAEYSGLDAVLWRVGFVTLALLGGSGFLVYLLLWILMPAGASGPDDRSGPLDEMVERLHTAVVGGRGTTSGG